MQQQSTALQRRWRAGAGACKIEDFPAQHTDYIMSMAMHGGHLITGGADKLIAITDMAWARRMARTKRDASASSAAGAMSAR